MFKLDVEPTGKKCSINNNIGWALVWKDANTWIKAADAINNADIQDIYKNNYLS